MTNTVGINVGPINGEGGTMANQKLRSFRVVGWQADPDDLKNASKRKPMKPLTLEAISEEMARQTYARCNQIPRNLWDWGKGCPPIIIRATPVFAGNGQINVKFRRMA